MLRLLLCLVPLASLCLLLHTSCTHPGLYKGPVLGISSQQGYTLNTAQKCIMAKETVDLAETVLPIIADELALSGCTEPRQSDYRKIMLCTIKRPEPCSGAGWTRGPSKVMNGKRVGARKRGCTIGSSIWVSLYWPPVCTESWLDEPHCVPSESQTSKAGWRQILIHELFNLAVTRWCNAGNSYSNYYNEKIYEVEASVMKRIQGI